MPWGSSPRGLGRDSVLLPVHGVGLLAGPHWLGCRAEGRGGRPSSSALFELCGVVPTADVAVVGLVAMWDVAVVGLVAMQDVR